MAPIFLIALSTYPKNDKARAELAADLLMRYHSPSGDLSGLAFLLPILHRSPGTDEVLRRAAKAREGAQFASAVLQVMLCASHFHPDLEMNASIAARGLEKVAFAASERTQWRLWGAHKSVSHLWLAIEATAERNPGTSARHIIFDHFQDILDTAESIRIYAEERRFIKRQTLWRVPASHPTTRVPLPVKPLTDAFLDAIASYEPPHRKATKSVRQLPAAGGSNTANKARQKP